MTRAIQMFLALALTGAVAGEASASSLRGSRAAMVEQNLVAQAHGLPFYRTPADIQEGVRAGELVELRGDENYDVADFVSHPFAHPAAVLFVERLAAQYRAECGQKLVVTSAVRPSNGQPRNAHALSVHPAGMAIDLRVSDRAECRQFLEAELLSLEAQGLLNGIREFRPPHYHVAIFPAQYIAYATPLMAAEAKAAAAAAARAEAEAAARLAAAPVATLHAAAEADAALPLGRRIMAAAGVMLLLALPLGHQALVDRRVGADRRSEARATPDRRRRDRQPR
jgi:hypothetical protein